MCWYFAGLSGKLDAVFGSDQFPRAAGSRIRDALEAGGCARQISPEIGSMARSLAASKTAGAFLCIGDGAGEIGAWILDGMDHSSGLVALVQDAQEAAVLERELDRDVRASVHLQDAESFLHDVRAHRFDLIVDLIKNEHPRALQLGLGLLRPGGVYLASHLESVSNETSTECDEEQSEHEPLFEPDDFEFARFGGRLNSLIIVRRTERIRTKRRSRTKSR
jgi:SAM-dependent methyltransferase